MRKNIILTITISLVISFAAMAQRGYTSVEYIIGFGTGDLGSYVGKTSFRGAVFEYQRSVNTNVTAGFEVGWSTFYERKDYDTYSSDNQAISGVQYRTSNHVPIYLPPGPRPLQEDTDNDGVGDACDNCPQPNFNQINNDGDSHGERLRQLPVCDKRKSTRLRR